MFRGQIADSRKRIVALEAGLSGGRHVFMDFEIRRPKIPENSAL